MISKELLSEVLKEEVIKIENWKSGCIININVQRYSYRQWIEINAYEFAHLAKKWAIEQGYIIKVDLEIDIQNIKEPNFFVYVYHEGNLVYDNYDYNYHMSSKEYDIIIESCEWILKDINK